MEDIERKYFLMLTKMVTPTPTRQDFSFLLESLWNKEFYSIIELDDNRAQDGIGLRNKLGFDNILFGPARCLEVLIALAIRCEFELTGNGSIPSSAKTMFWEMITNLDLGRYDNRNWDISSQHKIDQILSDWLDRNYHVSGRGGLFPLRRFKKNQRNVEIWYQMMEYLIEKGVI